MTKIKGRCGDIRIQLLSRGREQCFIFTRSQSPFPASGEVGIYNDLCIIVLYVVLNWYFIIESMIYTHGLRLTVWSGEITTIIANCLAQRHKYFYDRACKEHCGVIVMFNI